MLKLSTNKYNTILIFMIPMLCFGIIISKDHRFTSHYQFGVKKKKGKNAL